MLKKPIVFILWVVTSSFRFILASEEPLPYVTCTFYGQLGNQLFEIATTLAHAWDHHTIPIFPDLNRTDSNIPINREKIFFRLDASPLPRPILHQYQHMLSFSKVDIPYHPDQHIMGLFQSWRYFHHHRDKILEIFAPSPEELSFLKSKYANLLKYPLTVGIHIRTFNKQWSHSIPFVGLDYYRKAIKLFPRNAIFVVFSDRINWCKHHFQQFNRPMIFIDKQDHVDDLYLMSMLKHNIIGNSTFSWWAAYLNKNPQKIVVAPNYYTLALESDVNMPDWVVISNDPYTPFPTDILDYDIVSKSIDTQ